MDLQTDRSISWARHHSNQRPKQFEVRTAVRDSEIHSEPYADPWRQMEYAYICSSEPDAAHETLSV